MHFDIINEHKQPKRTENKKNEWMRLKTTTFANFYKIAGNFQKKVCLDVFTCFDVNSFDV